MKQHIHSLLNDTSTKKGRIFSLCIQCLIVLSLVSFSISTLPNISPRVQNVLNIMEYVTVSAFSAEYLLRLYSADKKVKFIFSFFGLVDLLAILPFYLSTSIDLRSVRLFRLLRLFRIFKLIRYSKAIRRFRKMFVIAKEELILFGCASLIIIYISSVGIYYFENEAQPEVFKSVFHSMWWSVATLTTVGYGDAYPITTGGKIFTFLILIVGLGIVAVPAGIISSALTKAMEEEKSRKE